MNQTRKMSAAAGLFRRYRIYLVPALAILVMALILFTHERPPLFADYPEWTYHGVLLRDVLLGHPDTAYALKDYPVPNSLTTVGLGVLMLILPWAAAAKLWLLVEVALGLWCAARLQKAAGGHQSWQIIVLTAGSLMGINLWYGFANFQFATFLAMLFGALLIEQFHSRWIYGALLVLLFFSHMIPFGFAVCMLLAYARQTGRWKLLWQSVPSLLLCVWYFLGRLTHANIDADAGMQSSVHYASLAFAAFRLNTCLKCWGLVNPVSSFYSSVLLRLAGSRLFVTFFALDVIVGCCVIILATQAAVKAIRRRDRTWFFWLTAALFFLVGLVMPGSTAGISDPGVRMLQLSLWCAVCVLLTRSTLIGRALSVCATVLIALSLYQMMLVAERPPIEGDSSSLPARLREFDHVEYSSRSSYYDKISRRTMDAPIYPTAMFTERSRP